MLKIIFFSIITIYVIACVLLYISQERFLFFPSKLSQEHVFDFDKPFEEINLTVDEGVVINSLLFKSKESKGVVLFLHGNGGTIAEWGKGAYVYVRSGYDVLYIDYRGYGKSGGKINGESQLYDDTQIVYNYLKEKYAEEKIIVSGASIGTGIAGKIASVNKPKKLILNSPYYSLKSLIHEKIKIIPGIIMKYKFETCKILKEVHCPIVIFHGTEDQIIPVKHAEQLKKKYERILFFRITEYGHNNLTESNDYLHKMDDFLKD